MKHGVPGSPPGIGGVPSRSEGEVVEEMGYLYNDSQKKEIRKRLRSSLGLPEVLLWQQLKNSKLGRKFRRQYGVGAYSLDFYCPDFRLGIELDGATHDSPEQQEYDRQRTLFIQSANIKIIRFQNKDVLNNLDSVVSEIKKTLA